MRVFKRCWFKILILLPFIPVGILIYSFDRLGIDDSLRFLAALVLAIASLLLFCLGFYLELGKAENKKIQYNMRNLISRVIFSILIIAFSYTIFNYAAMSVRFVGAIDDIARPTEKQLEKTYSLVTMFDFDVNNQGSYGRIGVLAVTDEAKDLAVEEFLSEQNFIPNPIPTVFNSPFDMINALYDDEIDALIVGNNFVEIFDELDRFEYIEDETIVLSQFSIEVEHVERVEIDPGEPFSILLLGLNSRNELSTGQINTFMLLTINLEELSFTAVSIPRDSYVPVPCFNYVSDKLSHTNVGGSDCAIGAIEHMFNMEIPYYVKLNFTGFMEIIDILGGIEVDVPAAFEEQDSRRRFGEHLIHLEAGPQRLNAEEALALSRHRGWVGDDFTRVENQQLVLHAMMQEMFNEVNGINDILPLLEVIGRHVETNLSSHDITTIANYILGFFQGRNDTDLMDDMHFINMVILGDTARIDVRQHGNLWAAFPWPGRVAEARRLMMINLGLEEPEFSFTFEFDGFTGSNRQWGQTNETYGSSGILLPGTQMYELVNPSPPVRISLLDRIPSLELEKLVDGEASDDTSY